MKDEKIFLSYGEGGKLTHKLINELIVKSFSNPILEKLNDSAVIKLGEEKFAFTTDSYVVNPIFFPGGDIGKLSVCGTINDLSMSGAIPLYITVSFIIEEGFDIGSLKLIINSISQSAKEANVIVTGGDIKVVNRGSADKLFINTSGIGIIKNNLNISGENAKPNDKVLVSGYIGDHGIAILSKRKGIEFDTNIESDCAPLNKLVSDMIELGIIIHCLRDPTRGGLVTTLCELAIQSNTGIIIEEERVPIREEVNGACEILGLDPLYVANEGKLVAIIPEKYSEKALLTMKKNKYGKNAKIIGEVTKKPEGKVLLKTKVGGTRILDMLTGTQLPRIC